MSAPWAGTVRVESVLMVVLGKAATLMVERIDQEQRQQSQISVGAPVKQLHRWLELVFVPGCWCCERESVGLVISAVLA